MLFSVPRSTWLCLFFARNWFFRHFPQAGGEEVTGEPGRECWDTSWFLPIWLIWPVENFRICVVGLHNWRAVKNTVAALGRWTRHINDAGIATAAAWVTSISDQLNSLGSLSCCFFNILWYNRTFLAMSASLPWLASWRYNPNDPPKIRTFN